MGAEPESISLDLYRGETFCGRNCFGKTLDEVFVQSFFPVFKPPSRVFPPLFKDCAISSSERLIFPSALRAVACAGALFMFFILSPGVFVLPYFALLSACTILSCCFPFDGKLPGQAFF